MSHTFVSNLTTTNSTFSSTAQIEPEFKAMDLPSLESTSKALGIFPETGIHNQHNKTHSHQHQKQPMQEQQQEIHHKLHQHHQCHENPHQYHSSSRRRAASSTSNFKSRAILPTRTISRGLFKGYNDMRRFNCFSKECSLNLNEFQNCSYCRHIPYIPSPLKVVECNKHNEEVSTSGTNDNKEIARHRTSIWASNNIENRPNEFGNKGEEMDALDDYLYQWKQQQDFKKMRVPSQGSAFIASREKSRQQSQQKQQKQHQFVSSYPSQSISNTLDQMSAPNSHSYPSLHEQHPSKLFSTVCGANQKIEESTQNKTFGMIGLLRNSDFPLKQKFIEIKKTSSRRGIKTQRSSTAPSTEDL
ncbi:hypothetical protein KGF57_003410 [Candida theae]|uniref:Uncharacterized protein n=1 Tax=Candida theae TaxID=1198502 RepID=A0AAD5BE40_9ASCO|nr:uncharacterized protein KGF57_003410 [Candida theae]KAI5956690.1 hypothetical protein KGF57_003410 [Candida theae]